MNEQKTTMNVMADNAIQEPQTINEQNKRSSYRGEDFEAHHATLSAAIDQLRKAAVTLDEFGLQVKLNWKKLTGRSKPPDKIKFPELPRHVSEDLAEMVYCEEQKQNKPRQISPWEKEKAEQKALRRVMNAESEQKAEFLRITSARMDGTLDENDPEVLSLEELRKMAKYDHVPNFPSFIESWPGKYQDTSSNVQETSK